MKSGQTQILIGNAHREFVQSTANNFLQPLKNFLEGDMKTIMVCLLPLKIQNFRTPDMLAVITLKFKQRSFHRDICPEDADKMTNSVDPDQTAPVGAV